MSIYLGGSLVAGSSNLQDETKALKPAIFFGYKLETDDDWLYFPEFQQYMNSGGTLDELLLEYSDVLFLVPTEAGQYDTSSAKLSDDYYYIYRINCTADDSCFEIYGTSVSNTNAITLYDWSASGFTRYVELTSNHEYLIDTTKIGVMYGDLNPGDILVDINSKDRFYFSGFPTSNYIYSSAVYDGQNHAYMRYLVFDESKKLLSSTVCELADAQDINKIVAKTTEVEFYLKSSNTGYCLCSNASLTDVISDPAIKIHNALTSWKQPVIQIVDTENNQRKTARLFNKYDQVQADQGAEYVFSAPGVVIEVVADTTDVVKCYYPQASLNIDDAEDIYLQDINGVKLTLEDILTMESYFGKLTICDTAQDVSESLEYHFEADGSCMHMKYNDSASIYRYELTSSGVYTYETSEIVTISGQLLLDDPRSYQLRGKWTSRHNHNVDGIRSCLQDTKANVSITMPDSEDIVYLYDLPISGSDNLFVYAQFNYNNVDYSVEIKLLPSTSGNNIYGKVSRESNLNIFVADDQATTCTWNHSIFGTDMQSVEAYMYYHATNVQFIDTQNRSSTSCICTTYEQGTPDVSCIIGQSLFTFTLLDGGTGTVRQINLAN